MQAKFIDDYLTESGKEMCQNALSSIEDLTLHRKVFVSPFRRTIESACNLLKTHPDKASFILVLTPGPLEHLGYKNVLMLHAEALKKFCGEMSAQHGLSFDTTFLEQY